MIDAGDTVWVLIATALLCRRLRQMEGHCITFIPNTFKLLYLGWTRQLVHA